MTNLHKFVMCIIMPSDSTLFASATCMLLVHDKHLHSVGLKAMATVIFVSAMVPPRNVPIQFIEAKCYISQN